MHSIHVFCRYVTNITMFPFEPSRFIQVSTLIRTIVEEVLDNVDGHIGCVGSKRSAIIVFRNLK